MKVGERTVNNALFNVISGLLPLLLSFVFWPYIVEQLGVSSYGIFALVGTVIGYFALLDLGLGNAVVKYVAEYAGKKDPEQVQAVIAAALSIFIAAGLAGGLIILVLARALATEVLKIPPELATTAFHAFCAASLGFFFTMLLTLFTAIINGLNRYDITSITMAVMGAASTIGAVVLLRADFGLMSVVWLNVIVPMLAALFYIAVIHHLLPDVHVQFRAGAAVIKRILHFGMYTMLGRVTDVVSGQVSLLIIGMILGVSSVTFYVIPFTILNRLTSLIGRAGMVIFPAISELQGQQRADTIRELYITASRIIISFAFAFTVPLLVFGIRFLTLWMGTEFAERGGVVLRLITVGVLVTQGTNVPTFVVNGLGLPKSSGMAALSCATIFLILMIPGAAYFGIIGVASAFTASAVMVAAGFIWYVNNVVLGLTVFGLIREVYLRPLLAGAVTAIPLLLIPQAHIHNLFFLLLVMGAGMGLYFIAALLFGVYQARERRVLMEYLGGVVTRLRGRRVP